MTSRPAWLPPLVHVGGEWLKVLVMLYRIFDQDFKQTERDLAGRPVRWDTRVLEGNYEEGFWHLITRTDPDSGERLLDTRRAERLPWCGPTISYCADAAVKMWDYMEGKGRPRTYLWLEELNYVVVLEKRTQKGQTVAFLITAFHVDGDSTRRGLRRKYEQRQR